MFSSYMRKARTFRVYDQPIGKGIAYGLAFGLTSGLTEFVSRYLPGDKRLATLIVAILARTKAVRNRIGEELSEVIATVSWILIVDQTLGLAKLAGDLLAMVGVQAQPSVIGASAAGIGNLFANLPGIGAFFKAPAGEPVTQMSGDYSYDASLAELSAEPLYLTAAESKIASINL